MPLFLTPNFTLQLQDQYHIFIKQNEICTIWDLLYYFLKWLYISLLDNLDIFVAVKIILILLTVAFYTLAERKIMAAVQRRKGPNVVGLFGLLQPIADGVKLLLKDMIVPVHANVLLFFIAPFVILVLSLAVWCLIPLYSSSLQVLPSFFVSSPFELSSFVTEDTNLFWNSIKTNSIDFTVVNFKYGLLFLLAVSSLNVYSIIIAGWSSNSKYAFLGALRSAAQMVSYEVSIGLTILPVILFSGSFNLTGIIEAQENSWYFIPLLISTIIFFISMLAETNRTPFDLTEAEAELVAGYNVEYSSMTFAMFFLGEYANMILMSTLMVIFFFGGWWLPFGFDKSLIGFVFKILCFCFLFVLVRASFPRYRYDQLMTIGWKVFLPITLSNLVFLAGLVYLFNAAPYLID